LHADGTGTGSGRSMPGIDLGSAVLQAVESGLIVKGGGHAMAAGITIKSGQLGPLRSFLADTLSVDVASARAASSLKVDAALTARGASLDLVRDLERAGPYGSGNPGPVFAFPAHRAKFAQAVGKGGHVSFALVSEDGARLKAIAFRAASSAIGDALLRGNDGAFHFAGSLGIDHYQGREQVQFRLTDLAKPKG
ncbi:MAG: single-stranded-DNA-specific exonuclease RecJ, partial [Alphaproteobacteria bacterium]|nr:single-stranded-DNA-specific exonuclease RecJ [Alphaproteobacteria bacterium]